MHSCLIQIRVILCPFPQSKILEHLVFGLSMAKLFVTTLMVAFELYKNRYVYSTNEFLSNEVNSSMKTWPFIELSQFCWAHAFFMPPDRMIGGILVFVLSVFNFYFNFNLSYNFWTLRDRDLIFGMHTPLMMPFQITPRSMSLWPSLCTKNSFFRHCCHRGGGGGIVFHSFFFHKKISC